MINQGASFFQANLAWVCQAAAQIRANVGDHNQLIFTGGNSAATSVQSGCHSLMSDLALITLPGYFFSSSCPAVDVVEIHDYTECVSSLHTRSFAHC